MDIIQYEIWPPIQINFTEYYSSHWALMEIVYLSVLSIIRWVA